MGIKINQMPNPSYVNSGGFVSQWCCKCGNRHIMYFQIHKGGKETGGQFVEINWFQDDVGTKLRKFYEKKKRGKK